MYFIRFALLLSASALFAQTNSTAEPALPPVIHVCFGGCARGEGTTLYLENGRYVDKDAQGIAAVYDVVKFTRDSVVMTRNDFRPRPAHATLTGRISPDGTALIDGKAHWSATTINPFQMAWGSAIASVPGTQPGRPSPAEISKAHACDGQANVTEDQAFDYAVLKMKSQDTSAGMCWFEKAANLGSARAQANLAAIYYRGIFGVSKDAAKAFGYAQTASAAGNPLAEQCLSLMYDAGDGAPKDPVQAEYWRNKSQSDLKREQLGEGPSISDAISVLSRKNGLGFSPMDVLRSFYESQDAADYAHYDKECRAGNFDACQTRNGIKQTMMDKGTFKQQ